MKRELKVNFIGFGSSYPLEDRLIYRLIDRHYQIHRDAKPDYVVVQGASAWEHSGYDDCVKILLNGENTVPDFNAFDYAIGFDHLVFGDRYIRLPLFAMYKAWDEVAKGVKKLSDSELLNRKFCSFVVSNAKFGDPMRQKFFERLSKYKKVDSGGCWMNNVGGPVEDKIDFCRGYKFNIAFENSSSPGYTTEKIMEAYAAETVPIYYGNPTIETDFRLESMVQVKDAADIERAVEEVIRLDQDDGAYLAKCREHCLSAVDPSIYERELEAFLRHIFDQPLEKAHRRCNFGYQLVMREHMRKLMKLNQWISKARQILCSVIGH